MRISQLLAWFFSFSGSSSCLTLIRVEVTIRTREVASSGGVFGTSVSESVPCGAVVVAQGAQDPLVKMELRQAVCALLGLSASSVSVVTGGE